MSTIHYTSYPRTLTPPDFLTDILQVFRDHEAQIATQQNATGLKSDAVLALLRPNLEDLGFIVESGKTKKQQIVRPVFFGEDGKATKTYSVDGFWPDHACGLEIEAGRAVGGNAIYRDLIQAMVMVDLDVLCLAVPNVYRYGSTQTHDYRTTTNVADALFGHSRLTMPYRLIVIGY